MRIITVLIVAALVAGCTAETRARLRSPEGQAALQKFTDDMNKIAADAAARQPPPPQVIHTHCTRMLGSDIDCTTIVPQ